MSTVPSVEVDEQTRDELQPPCETGRDDNAATRVLHWHVNCDHLTPIDLYCTPCTDKVVSIVNDAKRDGADAVCRICHAPVKLLRVEPLR